ncbi:MAG: DUF1850 domain-containing protein [Proteobacteria bacterium]|nr:DUF1850 domain-containing protein [Pseudomonadota bacterium]
MAGLCLTAGVIAATLPLQAFTLAWTHSIEKVRWEEDYRIIARRLVLTEARIKGTGAGMEPPADAILKNGVWHYRPALAPLETLRLSHSPYAAGYEICGAGGCRQLADVLTGIADTQTIVIAPCDP